MIANIAQDPELNAQVIAMAMKEKKKMMYP
jgi:hypothetical protein